MYLILKKKYWLLIFLVPIIFSCDSKEPVNTKLKEYLQGNWFRGGRDVDRNFYKSSVTFNDEIMVWKDSIVSDTAGFKLITVNEGYCKVEYVTKDGNYGHYFDNPKYEDWPDLLIVHWDKSAECKITKYQSTEGSINQISQQNAKGIIPPILSAYVQTLNYAYMKLAIASSTGQGLFEDNWARSKMP